MAQYITALSEARLNHGICEEYAEEHFGKVLARREKQATEDASAGLSQPAVGVGDLLRPVQPGHQRSDMGAHAGGADGRGVE